MTAVVTGSVLVLGCFVLAAVVHSRLPLFAVYAAVGPAAVGLPLRLYPATVRVTIATWFAAFAGAAAYDLTGARPHLIMMTALFLAGLCGLAGYSGRMSVQDVHNGPMSPQREDKKEAERSRTVLAYLAALLVVSAVGGIAAAVAPVVAPHLLVAVVAGLVDGPHRMDKRVGSLNPSTAVLAVSLIWARYTHGRPEHQAAPDPSHTHAP